MMLLNRKIRRDEYSRASDVVKDQVDKPIVYQVDDKIWIPILRRLEHQIKIEIMEQVK